MARLIDADALIKRMETRIEGLITDFGQHDSYVGGFEEGMVAVEDAETVDAVEVVRCKDCRMEAMCRITQRLGEDGFCSNGERKEQ